MVFLWRPVLNKMATLTEVRRNWTLDDLLDCHELLDERERLMEQAMQKAKAK
jgi:hypothetical protein